MPSSIVKREMSVPMYEEILRTLQEVEAANLEQTPQIVEVCKHVSMAASSFFICISIWLIADIIHSSLCCFEYVFYFLRSVSMVPCKQKVTKLSEQIKGFWKEEHLINTTEQRLDEEVGTLDIALVSLLLFCCLSL